METSPPTSRVVAIDSRHSSRSWRILSSGPMSVGSHPSEVQRVHRAQHVGRLFDVVVHDERHGGRDLERIDIVL